MKLNLKKRKEIKEFIIIKNLDECLKSIGISKSELAKELKLSRAYITDISKGRRNCPDKLIKFLRGSDEV